MIKCVNCHKLIENQDDLKMWDCGNGIEAYHFNCYEQTALILCILARHHPATMSEEELFLESNRLWDVRDTYIKETAKMIVQGKIK